MIGLTAAAYPGVADVTRGAAARIADISTPVRGAAIHDDAERHETPVPKCSEALEPGLEDERSAWYRSGASG
jgi:hypothetical protein